MINIIKDSKRTLNLNPLVIYFLFTPEEKEKYQGIVEGFNANRALTLGLFKFQAVSLSSDPESSVLLHSVVPSGGGNMLVRFFDRDEGEFSYGVANADFSLPGYKLEKGIESEVKDIARIDLRNLKAYAETESEPSDAALFSKMARFLEDALSGSGPTDIRSGFLSEYIASDNLGRSLPPGLISDIGRLKQWRKHKDKDVEDFLEKFNLLLEEYGIPSEEESAETFSSRAKLKSGYYSRNEPESTPEFVIGIDRIKKNDNDHEYDYKFMVRLSDKEEYEIRFDYKDPKILFLSLLLCTAYNEPLYREDFKKAVGKGKRMTQGMKWVKFAFDKISPGEFIELWFEKMAKNNLHALSLAKSRCNSVVESSLSEFPELNYYFQIQKRKKKEKNSSVYFLHLQPDQIEFPSQWDLFKEDLR